MISGETHEELKQKVVELEKQLSDVIHAEAALKNERKFLFEVLYWIDSLVIVIDLNGRIVSFNRSSERLSGYCFEDVKNKPFWDFLLTNDEMEGVKSAIQDVVDKGMPNTFQNYWVSKDGRRYLISWVNSPLGNTDGTIEYILCTGHDITKRKRAEEALSNSEMRFRELADSLPQVIFETDRQGNLTYVNDKAYSVFGYHKKDFDKGMSALETLIPEDRELAATNISRVMEGENTSRAEYTALKKDGTTFPISIHSNRIVAGEEVCGIRGVLIDLTEFKNSAAEKRELEIKLQQAQKMEAIGTLAGGIAHDFNNILGALIGYIELTKLDVTEQNTQNNLNQALVAADRAKDLVKQILAFSRQTDKERVPVQLDKIAEEVIKFIRATTPTTIDVRQETDENIGAVFANPTEIHQIIMNFCTNAIHAIGQQNGVLKIKIQNVDVDKNMTTLLPELDPGPYVNFTFADTGHGMTTETRSRIFDPYFTTKEKGVGTGLGLAVVHGIVKGYDGAISVDSKPGKGTTFNVYLPRIELGDPYSEEIAELPKGGNERILFVDDEKMLVDIGKKMLERLGYKVATRTSPLEALELFKAKPHVFDLVITDQTMPGITGDKFAQKLMQVRSDIPVILCTGYSQIIDENRAQNNGIKAFISKPILLNDMGSTVRKVLDQNVVLGS